MTKDNFNSTDKVYVGVRTFEVPENDIDRNDKALIKELVEIVHENNRFLEEFKKLHPSNESYPYTEPRPAYR